MSEGAAQLLIIAAAFVVTYLPARFTRVYPMAIGFAVPILAAIGVVIQLSMIPSESSTEALAVPFIAIFAAMGSIPAAFLADFQSGRLK